MSQLDWITEKSYGKYTKNAAQEELNSFYGIAKSMRDSGMEHEVIAENLKTMYGATPEQVEMIQNEVLGKTALRINDRGEFDTKEDYEEFEKVKNNVLSGIEKMIDFVGKERVEIIIENIFVKVKAL